MGPARVTTEHSSEKASSSASLCLPVCWRTLIGGTIPRLSFLQCHEHDHGGIRTSSPFGLARVHGRDTTKDAPVYSTAGFAGNDGQRWQNTTVQEGVLPECSCQEADNAADTDTFESRAVPRGGNHIEYFRKLSCHLDLTVFQDPGLDTPILHRARFANSRNNVTRTPFSVSSSEACTPELVSSRSSLTTPPPARPRERIGRRAAR